MIAAFEQQKIDQWVIEIDQSSVDKLKQSLLRRVDDSRWLAVNFDDALVRLLREVKYFLQLDLLISIQFRHTQLIVL